MTPGEFCVLSYKAPGEVDQYLAECGVFNAKYHFYDWGSTQAYLFKGTIRDQDTWILTVRGTEPSQTEDILVDLHAHPFSQNSFPGCVHHGFYEEARQLYLWVIEHLTIPKLLNPKQVQIACIGHSLGAGVTTLVAMMLDHTTNIIEPTLWTFGSPRVGDSEFAHYANKRMYHRITRVVHNNDWVARVPPAWYRGYRHVGKLLYANRFNEIRKLGMFGLLFDKLWSRIQHLGKKGLDAMTDHGMIEYRLIEIKNSGFFPEYNL